MPRQAQGSDPEKGRTRQGGERGQTPWSRSFILL